MEPQIQYVTTSDGVSIAYYAIGQGPATLFLFMPTSHLEAEWQIAPMRMGFTAMAQRCTLIRLDPRGFGLSDRDPPDFAIDSFVLDIEAVVDRLGLDELRVYSYGMATMPALAYTARHPDTVTHFVQAMPAASYEDAVNDRLLALGELAKIDQKLAVETSMRSVNPEFSEQLARDFADLAMASIEGDSIQRLVEEMKMWDVEAEAVSLSTPTLLIHDRKSPDSNIAATRRVAGLIKNSRVAFVDNMLESPLLAQRFFDDDVSDPTDRTPKRDADPPDAGAFRTILFTDVEGSTALTDRLGDARARDLLREHERMVRTALNEHTGSEVKTMGDGFMASFTSASAALECAIALQRAFAGRNDSADEPIKVRVGLNAGEPISEEDSDGRTDLFGTAVIEAARITSIAEGGEILAANVVRELTKGKDFLFADRGEQSLRGFEDPVRLFEVRWRE
jgi:class 3 adenylate cyclase